MYREGGGHVQDGFTVGCGSVQVAGLYWLHDRLRLCRKGGGDV